jgi:hypothetical protein
MLGTSRIRLIEGLLLCVEITLSLSRGDFCVSHGTVILSADKREGIVREG